MTLSFETVDVFTDTAFGGNPLAVVFGGEALATERLQAIAREFNYSETTFVLPPSDPANTARVRIFSGKREMPFAGHPNVGTAAVVGWRGELFGKPVGDAVVFEEIAGLVPVALERAGGDVRATTLTAPAPFAAGHAVPVAEIAACLGLSADATASPISRPSPRSARSSAMPIAGMRAAPGTAAGTAATPSTSGRGCSRRSATSPKTRPPAVPAGR